MAGKSRRGFASMDPSKQREIASKGGRAAHAKGTAHEWSSDEARTAGRKGGEIVSRDRTHMAAIGREGGEARGRKARVGGVEDGTSTESPMAASQGSYSDREAGLPMTRELPGIAAGSGQNSGAQTSSTSADVSRSTAEGRSDLDRKLSDSQEVGR